MPEITVGKWTTAGGERVEIVYQSKRCGCWFAELLSNDGNWRAVRFHDEGESVCGCYRLLTPGWPLELRDGGWYQDNIEQTWFLMKMPAWCKLPWLAIGPDVETAALNASGTFPESGSMRLTEELPEPPAWARETKER